MNNYKKLILILIICIFLTYYFTYDINFINKSYNKKFYFNKFQYNYYTTLNKIIINPRSSIKQLEIFSKLNINSNDVILDVGCGEGMNLLFFNKFYKFKLILGIEIDDKIFQLCKKNIKLSKSKKIILINKDILKFDIPKNVNFIYLFNPFEKNFISNMFFSSNYETLKYDKFIKQVLNSFKLNKRKIYIIFMNINDSIYKIFSKKFKVIEDNYLFEYFILKVRYTIFLLI